MKQSLNYNIHNILKYQIILDQKFNLINYLNIEHRFFEVDDVENPDIILNIGKFKPSNEDCYLVDSKYYIKENYFYCKDSVDKTKWEVEIFGFESGETKINFDIKVPGFRGLLPILGAHNLFLSPLIDYKLSQKGYFLLHSAGLSKDNKAFLLAGMGGAFKTTLAMDFIRKAGFNFFGDERIILCDGSVWSYPVSLVSFGFRCKYLPTEKKRNFLDKIGLIKYNYENYDHLNNVGVNVAEMTTLGALFFITKNANKKSVGKKNCSLEDAIDRLVINDKMEMSHAYMPSLMGISSNPYFEYMLAYSFVFPNSKVATHWDNLKIKLKKSLKNIPLYDVELPIEYDDNIFKEVYEHVNSVVY